MGHKRNQLSHCSLRTFINFNIFPKVCIHNGKQDKSTYLIVNLAEDKLKYVLMSNRTLRIVSHKTVVAGPKSEKASFLGQVLMSRGALFQVGLMHNGAESRCAGWMLRFTGADNVLIAFVMAAFRGQIAGVVLDDVDVDYGDNAIRLAKVVEQLADHNISMNSNVSLLKTIILSRRLWYPSRHYQFQLEPYFDWNDFTPQTELNVQIAWRFAQKCHGKAKFNEVSTPYLTPLLSQDRVWRLYGGFHLEDILDSCVPQPLTKLEEVTCWIRFFDSPFLLKDIFAHKAFIYEKFSRFWELAPGLEELHLLALASHVELQQSTDGFCRMMLAILTTFVSILESVEARELTYTFLAMVYVNMPKDLSMDWFSFCLEKVKLVRNIVENMRESNVQFVELTVQDEGHSLIHVVWQNCANKSLSICLDGNALNGYNPNRQPRVFERYVLE